MVDQAFSCIDQVAQCAMDELRSGAFQKAIHQVVRPHHRVIDVGTGSGLLAMFAAQAGAKDIVAVENDDLIADTARNLISHNGFSERIKILKGDARDFKLEDSRPFDVVIMELLTTGMIDEMQVPAINHLHNAGLVHKDTIYVPGQLRTYACLAEVNYHLCGLDMKMIRHEWFDFSPRKRTVELSKNMLISSETFNRPVSRGVDKHFEFEIEKTGTVNAVILKSETILADNISVWDTFTLNAPVVVPLTETTVTIGDRPTLHIKYNYAEGFNNFSTELVSKGNVRAIRPAA